MNLKTINSVKLLKIVTLLLVVVGGFSLSSHQSFAVSAADWRAGNIIDDSIFFDKNSMSVGEIQAFLNSKVPVCDTSGSKPSEYGGGTRAQYGASKGYPAPFVCLKDYYENPSTKANNLHGSPIPPGGISAAQIIWNVSQQFGISPKVMLVMLHKESDRLMIDDWPWSTQYRTAMGYGCPDSGPNYSANCNPNDYGFYTQMYSAARQFRLYANSPNSYNFVAGRNNTIQYNPDPACGSSVVYIENQATAGLYNYTPYQPNQGALNAGYGTAPCGAYGNRNFWKLYNDWFGSTKNTRPYTNLTWVYENLDGANDGINPHPGTVGLDPSTIIFDNKLYVFYSDLSNGTLKASYADSSGWHTFTIDGQGGTDGQISDSVGRMSSVTIFNNDLHIFYYNQTRSSLRHAWLSGASHTWSYENLDGDPGSVGGALTDVGYGIASLVLDNSLQLFYYDRSYGNLRHAWYTTSSGWKFENLDGDPGSVGGFNSNVGQSPSVTLYANGIQLFYYDAGQGNLRHAWTTSSGWKFENLDGDPGSVGGFNSNVGPYSTAAVLAGGLQLFYYDIAQGNLRHAWTTSSGWKFENLDGDPGSVGGFNSNVGQDPHTTVRNGVIYVFYRDVNSGLLRAAWAEPTGWRFAILEGSFNSDSNLNNNTGFTPVSLVYGNSLQLFYFDNTARALRHAYGLDR